MNYQLHMIDVTQKAADEAFKYARSVPADKVDWKVSETARSVLDQCQEMALCPKWAQDIVTDQPQPEWNDEAFAAMNAEKAQFDTIDKCQAECNRRLQDLFEVYRSMPDADLAKTKWLPYDGGRDFTMVEMMDYPRWNFNYHLGQIAFIQTVYGDKEMH